MAAAIAARRKGFRVTVADGQRPPIDKPCGEGLGPDALAAAEALGISIPRESAFAVRGIRFLGAGGTSAAHFQSGFALGLRRTVLHGELARQAEACGVRLLWGTPVTGISDQFVTMPSGKQRARWIVGADGERSRVRGWAGLDGNFLKQSRFTFRQHYRVAPWSDLIEIHWGEKLQAYVTPVGADEVGIACGSYDPRLRVEMALEAFPELCRRLDGAPVVSSERGALSSTRSLPAVYKGSIALLGDASGSVDVITGQGLGIAFLQAAALADAMEHGDLAPYQAAHRRIRRIPALNARILLAMDRWPWVGRRTRAAFARRPDLFDHMLALHSGEPRHILDRPATLARLGWNVLRG